MFCGRRKSNLQLYFRRSFNFRKLLAIKQYTFIYKMLAVALNTLQSLSSSASFIVELRFIPRRHTMLFQRRYDVESTLKRRLVSTVLEHYSS